VGFAARPRLKEAKGYALQIAREVARNHPLAALADNRLLLLDSAVVVVFNIPLKIEYLQGD
jgi:hypothetical protein